MNAMKNSFFFGSEKNSVKEWHHFYVAPDLTQNTKGQNFNVKVKPVLKIFSFFLKTNISYKYVGAAMLCNQCCGAGPFLCGSGSAALTVFPIYFEKIQKCILFLKIFILFKTIHGHQKVRLSSFEKIISKLNF
jgi:hypothetical protein